MQPWQLYRHRHTLSASWGGSRLWNTYASPSRPRQPSCPTTRSPSSTDGFSCNHKPPQQHLRVLLRWSQISSIDCIAESAISPLEHFSSNLASKSTAQAGSRSFQVRSRGVNFRLTRGTAVILKIQTRRRCCVRHSSPGMTLTSRV